MTKIDPESPVVRETESTFRGTPIILEIHPRYTRLRLKGKKTMAFNLPHNAAFERAMKNAYGVAAPEPAKGKRVKRGLIT